MLLAEVQGGEVGFLKPLAEPAELLRWAELSLRLSVSGGVGAAGGLVGVQAGGAQAAGGASRVQVDCEST